MKADDIHVGDILSVRLWDDMKAELGIDEDGDIIPPEESISYFSKDMRYMCGSVFTVKCIKGEPDDPALRSEENVEECGYGIWRVKAWMLEPCAAVEETVELPGDSGGLFSFLLSE